MIGPIDFKPNESNIELLYDKVAQEKFNQIFIFKILSNYIDKVKDRKYLLKFMVKLYTEMINNVHIYHTQGKVPEWWSEKNSDREFIYEPIEVPGLYDYKNDKDSYAFYRTVINSGIKYGIKDSIFYVPYASELVCFELTIYKFGLYWVIYEDKGSINNQPIEYKILFRQDYLVPGENTGYYTKDGEEYLRTYGKPKVE